ncbi:MAG: hypothetical protein KAR42_13340 [candidate division Zixibacteria bacterium]|nr:hypothetical protein [candidate division Zixibacteria bacterium]
MKRIKLTQRKFALVDDCDFEWLNKWKWSAVKSKQTWYASRNVKNIVTGKNGTISMHRQILNAPKGMQVDHRNHNGLNNQRHNIRICTLVQNHHNRQPIKKTSVYKGVCWDKIRKKWTAQIHMKRKKKHLGFFVNEVEAANMYDVMAKKLFGEFAYLNFSKCVE